MITLEQKRASEISLEQRRQRERLRLDQDALASAVKQRDFLRAHAIDQRIRALEAELGSATGDAPTMGVVLQQSLRAALGGGLTGAAAMGVQVGHPFRCA